VTVRERFAGLRQRSGFVFDVFTLASGAAAAQVILACSTPLLTRLYAIEDFGRVQAYLAAYAFAFVVVAWRYELAILLPAKDDVAAALVAVALIAVVVTSATVAFAAATLPWDTLVPASYAFLRPYRWLWPITLLGGGGYLVISQWALRRGAYGEVTTTRVTQTVGQVGSQLLLAGRVPGVWGLLVGDAIGRTAGTVRLARALWRRDRELFLRLRPASLAEAARRYAGFPLISSVSALVNTGGFAVPTLMLGGMFGTQVLGWYGLVDRVLGLPSVLVGLAASQAYTAHAARMATADLGEARRFFRHMLWSLAGLGAAPFAVLLFLGPFIFSLVFGAAWREAGVYASILALPHFVGFVAWPVMPTLNVLERQGWQLAWDTARLVLACGSLWIAARLTNDARTAVAAYGGAILLSYAAHATLCWIALRTARPSQPVLAPHTAS